MRYRMLLAILIIFIFGSCPRAQNNYDFSQFTHETGRFFTQPSHWRGSDWFKLGLIAGGTVLIMQVDQPIRDAVLNGGQRHFRSVPIEAGRIWGEWYAPPIVVASFGVHGWLANSRSSDRVAFELVQAVTYSEAITQTLKIAFGRARPYENQGAFSYHPLNVSRIGFHSLPGGHNTEGWAMSTVLSRSAHSKALQVIAYLPSVLTFVSRIYQDQHWTSDDFLGAAIGVAVGTWVVNQHDQKESALSSPAVYPFTVNFSF